MEIDITSKIYEEIRNRIITRQIVSDIKINQNHLAKELNVSRTPVVKALHILSSEGLVDNIPNKGFYLHKNTLQETADLFALRQCIEMVASESVAEMADMKDIKALRDIFADFINTDKIDYDAYYAADSLFHTRLIELSQNNLLLRINRMSVLMPKAFSTGLLRSPSETIVEHIEWISALEKRDAALAQTLAKEHLDITTQRLRKTISRLRSIGIDPSKILTQDITRDGEMYDSKSNL